MKKIPPWAWAIAAVGVGVAIYLYKKSKESKEISESSSESEAPVVAGVEPEEYPYSIAGLGGGGASGAIGNASESNQEFREFALGQQEFQKTFSSQEAEFQKSLAELIKQENENLSRITGGASGAGSGTISEGSGGGAPTSGSSGGTVAPPPPTHAPSCPSSFPHFNGKGSPNNHTCYKDITCGNGCQGHKYQDGHSECQTKTGGKCHW